MVEYLRVFRPRRFFCLRRRRVMTLTRDEPMDKSNSTDESQHQGDEHSQTGEPPHEAPAPITIDTADPVIDKMVEHPSDRKLHPDATISVETTQVSESDLLAATGVRTVFAEKKHGNSQDRPQDQNGRSKNRGGQEAPQHDADRGRDQEEPWRRPISATAAFDDEEPPDHGWRCLGLRCDRRDGLRVLFRAEVQGIVVGRVPGQERLELEEGVGPKREVRRWGK